MNLLNTAKKRLAILAAAFAIPLPASASFFGLVTDAVEVVKDTTQTVVIKVEDDSRLGRILFRLGGVVLDEIPGANTYLVSVPSLPLSLPSGVTYLEVNEQTALPADFEVSVLDISTKHAPLWYAKQPAMQVIKTEQANRYTTGLGVVVAVIDARFDESHPALAPRLVPGYDFTTNSQDSDGELNQSSVNYMFEDDSTSLNQSSVNYMFEDDGTSLYQSSVNYMFEDSSLNQSSVNYMFEDTVLDQSSVNYMFEDTVLDQSSVNYMFEESGLKLLDSSLVKLATPASAGYTHGTFTAGVVAAVAPNAQIMPLRAFDNDGKTDLFTLAKAIWYAVDNGADVINMSWGTSANAKVLRDAVRYARDHRVIMVASAGNMNSDYAYYPAAYGAVIAVAATDDFDRKANFSSYGEHVFVSAPGVNIISAYPDGSYAVKSGTSFSAPMVAAQAALLKSAQVGRIKGRILGGSVDLDGRNPDYENQLGRGRVDLLESLKD